MYYLIINNTFGCYLSLAVTLIIFMIYSMVKKENIGIAVLIIIMFFGISFGTPVTRSITCENINTLSKDINNIITAVIYGKEEIEESFDKAGTGRMALWVNGIKFFLERPILGYGPENLEAKYATANLWYRGQDRPHNLLIQLATTSGVIGLVTYVSAVSIILIRGLKRSKLENSIHVITLFVIIAYLISAMFGNSMYYTSPYFFIFLGVLMSENMKNMKKNEK